MIVTFQFDTDKDNNDKQQALAHMHCMDMQIALWDIQEALRKYYKYDESLTEDQRVFISKFRNEVQCILNEKGIDNIINT